jgi:hypothetical protein
MTACMYLYGACILLLATSGCGEFENERARWHCDVGDDYAYFELIEAGGRMHRGAIMDATGVTFRVAPQAYAKRWTDIPGIEAVKKDDGVAVTFRVRSRGSVREVGYSGVPFACWDSAQRFLELNRIQVDSK